MWLPQQRGIHNLQLGWLKQTSWLSMWPSSSSANRKNHLISSSQFCCSWPVERRMQGQGGPPKAWDAMQLHWSDQPCGHCRKDLCEREESKCCLLLPHRRQLLAAVFFLTLTGASTEVSQHLSWILALLPFLMWHAVYFHMFSDLIL